MFLLVLFTAFGLTTQGIFLFQREWFDRPDRVVPLMVAEVLLFTIALVLEYTNVHMPNDTFLLLKLPLLSLLLYKAMQWGFVRLFGYRPRDTWYSMDWRLLKDGVFNFFWMMSTLVPIGLIFGRIL